MRKKSIENKLNRFLNCYVDLFVVLCVRLSIVIVLLKRMRMSEVEKKTNLCCGQFDNLMSPSFFFKKKKSIKYEMGYYTR